MIQEKISYMTNGLKHSIEEPGRDELLYWLQENDEIKLRQLWQTADRVRRELVGDSVYLRGIVEISNYCRRACTYCGLNVTNNKIVRYQMSAAEILHCAGQIKDEGYGTIVLQAGEHDCIGAGWMAELISAIKRRTGLAVTLSLGEREPQELAAWKEAGADRYLLKIETCDRRLYNKIHPPRQKGYWLNRLQMLEYLKALGYECGSGIMLGLPGQSYFDLINALHIFRELELDMIGMGPYIPHMDTPLGKESVQKSSDQQVPAGDLITYKMIALCRIMCPDANIPSTTALATIKGNGGRLLGLARGANVVMPNFTPMKYRLCYDIYPGRVAADRDDRTVRRAIVHSIMESGRMIGCGPGWSPGFLKKQARNVSLEYKG